MNDCEFCSGNCCIGKTELGPDFQCGFEKNGFCTAKNSELVLGEEMEGRVMSAKKQNENKELNAFVENYPIKEWKEKIEKEAEQRTIKSIIVLLNDLWDEYEDYADAFTILEVELNKLLEEEK